MDSETQVRVGADGWMPHLMHVQRIVMAHRSLCDQQVAVFCDLVLRDAQVSLCAWKDQMDMASWDAAFDCLAHARAQVRDSGMVGFDKLDVAVNPKR